LKTNKFKIIVFDTKSSRELSNFLCKSIEALESDRTLHEKISLKLLFCKNFKIKELLKTQDDPKIIKIHVEKKT
jgi:hypothetical protein